MNPIERAYYLCRHLGPGWLLFRLRMAAAAKARSYERSMPVRPWPGLVSRLLDPSLADTHAYSSYRKQLDRRFFFTAKDRDQYAPILARFDANPHASPQGRAFAIARGEFPFFESQTVSAGIPPNWHRNPFTSQETFPNSHWSRIGDFGSGDIKLIWELNRFSFVYPLVRAWFRHPEPLLVETFWRLVESWRGSNPPNCGANWKCGQETSLRVMAWCFGLHAFLHAPETTPERLASLSEMIAVSGERIAAHIDYALSQRNNHGISEALGLFTIGLLFPEFRGADCWLSEGRRHLEQLGHDLIYEDGAFSQHSGNYHRLMLHDYLWALRLGELNGIEFSSSLRDRIRLAGQFLHQIQDASTGFVPCFGQNDGALVLPLNNCSPLDFRPVVQSTRYLSDRRRTFADGPWDEDLLWIFGRDALQAPVDPHPRVSFAAPRGGCWTLRSPDSDSFVFVRAPHFRDRPSQADLLHLDLWRNGINVALDPGTFSYNAPEPFNNSFAETRFHNTVSVHGRDQMQRVGKFLWLPWARGTGALQTLPSGAVVWEGEHDGYVRPFGVRHRRAVLPLAGGSWLILDRLIGPSPHECRLHWLLANLPHTWIKPGSLCLRMPDSSDFFVQFGSAPAASVSSVVADAASARGWRSPTYFTREPALSIALTAESDLIWFWTCFSPKPAQIAFQPGLISIVNDGTHRVLLGSGSRESIIKQIS